MRSNRFSISVIIQSVLLAVTGSAAVLILLGNYMLISFLVFLGIWMLQIFLLIWYVNKTNRELENFLQSIKYLDKVQLTGSGRSFKRLNLTYNEIIGILREERAIRETEFQYFRDTVEHINTGLISYIDDGTIRIMNRAACDILNCSRLEKINQLERVSPTLPQTILSLEPGRPQLVSLPVEGKILKLSLNLALFRIQKEYIKLVSITDIKAELEEGELEAWQKLIRVLTHEIVNSVTPINTLTTALISQLKKAGPGDTEVNQNLSSGIHAIRKRNKGLLAFVENFRRINKPPRPNFSNLEVGQLFEGLESLMKEELGDTELVFKVEVSFSIKADEELIMQVLINLLKNGVEAGADRFDIIAGLDGSGRPRISVRDNGKGIEEENLEKIFIPFYSSKKEGSGIGLSLSRQIMRLHRGSISVEETGGEGTSFTLTF